MRIAFKITFALSLAILLWSVFMLAVTRSEFWCIPILISGAMATLFGILIKKEK